MLTCGIRITRCNPTVNHENSVTITEQFFKAPSIPAAKAKATRLANKTVLMTVDTPEWERRSSEEEVALKQDILGKEIRWRHWGDPFLIHGASPDQTCFNKYADEMIYDGGYSTDKKKQWRTALSLYILGNHLEAPDE